MIAFHEKLCYSEKNKRKARSQKEERALIFYLKDYEQYYEGEDVTLALQEALRECKRHPGSTLKLGGGEIHFYGKYAFENPDLSLPDSCHGKAGSAD